jgi:hypothetical protein
MSSRHPRRMLALAACLFLLPACSIHTSITREANGDYVITGHAGSSGYVWICSYDPATKTLTVKDKQ